MIALNLLFRITANSLLMIRTTTTIVEIGLGSIVSCCGTTGPVVIPFSSLSRFSWAQRSTVWELKSRLTERARGSRQFWGKWDDGPMSKFSGCEQSPQATLAFGLGYAQEWKVKFDRNCFYNGRNWIYISYKSTGLYVHDNVYGLDMWT
jgi:hypothetical protein